VRGPRVEPLENRDLPSGNVWTPLVNPAPAPLGTMLLLSDGTVMVQGGGGNTISKDWYRLTPISTGGYVGGSWSTLAPMHTPRAFFASDVLRNGDVFLAGGEYTDAGKVRTNTGEIYDPNTNAWQSISNFPQSRLGDAPSELMPGGNVLVGYIRGTLAYSYNPSTNIWAPAANLQNGDTSSEESWVKLRDGSILTYSIDASVNDGVALAQRYVPAINRWVPAGVLPVRLSSPEVGDEIGPAFLLPTGRALFLGANGRTAEYKPTTSSWTRGPDIPDKLSAGDAPGAMLPNGQVILAASKAIKPTASGQTFHFSAPTRLFEFHPATNTISRMPVPRALDDVFKRISAGRLRMLVLPSGQLLLSDGTNDPWILTPSGSAAPSWKSNILGVAKNPNGSFTLTGERLNGISEGASYGDDAQMATNYPLVQLRNATAGTVTYARSFDWSSTGVATGRMPETAEFTLPPGLAPGAYRLTVIANGIGSRSVDFRVTGPAASS
jgi:hypothetical protein